MASTFKANVTIMMMYAPFYIKQRCTWCTWDAVNATFCTIKGDPLHPPPPDADISAMWYFLPDMKASIAPVHLRPDVPVVGYSPESAARYPWMNNATFMRQFDIEHSYRVHSKLVPFLIPQLYGAAWIPPNEKRRKDFFRPPPVPTRNKINAVVCIISNCHDTANHREEFVKRLMAVMRVDSYGKCLNNMGHIEPYTYNNHVKDDIIGKYRFCVAFENSIEVDYVTEKVLQGLWAGCLPLYWGAPNLQDFLPYNASRMVVNRDDFPTEELFFQEIKRLSEDDAAFEEYMSWRDEFWAGKPFHPAFNTFLEAQRWYHPADMCPLVKVLVTGMWKKPYNATVA